jgi:excinuclease ABC subunit C
MVDGHGELIYVGKAKCLRTRVLSYFRPRSRDPKAGRIVQRMRTLVWEPCPSEFGALHRELELIRRWRPRFNVQGQPRGRSYTYVCLGSPPAPYAFLARQPPAGALACFGPVPGGRKPREAVRWLNDWFQLRDCSQAQPLVFADQAELFPVLRSAGCLRYELGTCLGPCVAGCSRPEYTSRVADARAFLAGDGRKVLEELEREMQAAAGAQAYERAAALRDKAESFRWLRDQLDRLRVAREQFCFVYPVPGTGGKDLWYVIRGGRTVAVTLPPGNGKDPCPARHAAAVIAEAYRGHIADAGTLAPHEADGLLLVTSWFRRYPEERKQTLEPDRALALCRESGGPLV